MSERPRLLPQVAKVLRHPGKLARLRSPAVRWSVGRLLFRSLGFLLVRPRRRAWEPTSVSGIRRRRFRDYDSYVRVQRSKLKLLNLGEYDKRFRRSLRQRLDALALDLHGKPVVCLGARSGAEVQAFQDRGAFAVGIDLNPGEGNPFVLLGDFHAIQFPDASASVVYTNSLDHAYDIEAVATEVRRILVPEGRFVLEVMKGQEEGNDFGRWEASSWDSVDALLSLVQGAGFSGPDRRLEVEMPWNGECFVLSRGESGDGA